ncbi:unnamed protein product [Lasius platythorax]|uniref:Uncharacterized protein n=2 Tax=Lasius platythorax TaxID=488582 RepID=A0AAV2N8A2_9HYME
MKLQLIEHFPDSCRERHCLYIFWEEARTYRMMVVYHDSGYADRYSPVGSSAILHSRWETWVLVELGLIVPGKTSLIIPQRQGIIRAIRTAWLTKPVRQRQTNKRDKMKGTTEEEEMSKEVAVAYSQSSICEFEDAFS